MTSTKQMKCNHIDIEWATWLCKRDAGETQSSVSNQSLNFNIQLFQRCVCGCVCGCVCARVRKSRLDWDGSLHSEALTMPPFHSWPRSQGPAHLLPLPRGSALPLTGSLRLLPALLGLRGRGRWGRVVGWMGGC